MYTHGVCLVQIVDFGWWMGTQMKIKSCLPILEIIHIYVCKNGITYLVVVGLER
jgi:hypothetical protein